MTYLTIIIYKLSLLSYESVGFLIHFKFNASIKSRLKDPPRHPPEHLNF